MSNVVISDSIKYIGADDTTLDLFESQYQIPHGVPYILCNRTRKLRLWIPLMPERVMNGWQI